MALVEEGQFLLQGNMGPDSFFYPKDLLRIGG